MAKSPSEHIRDLSVEVGVLRDRDTSRQQVIEDLKESLRRESDRHKSDDEKRREEIAVLRRELAEFRQENAALRQQLLDHIKQVELWDGRRWGLIVLLLGAVLSLASGLIVTLAKR